jgi:phosphoglycolate phosphatase
VDLRRVKNLVFDFDGTVGDSYGPVTESFNHVLRHFGLRELSESEVRPWVGMGLELILTHYLGKDRLEEAVRIFREHYLKICRAGTKLMPGARETLDVLAGRYRMAMCSNKPGETLRSLADYLDISRYFTVCLGAYDVPHLKPHPDMLRKALAELAASQSDTLYVGDTVTDVEFADSCKVPCVLVLGGTGTKEDLESADAVAVLDGIAQLPELLGVTKRPRQ